MPEKRDDAPVNTTPTRLVRTPPRVVGKMEVVLPDRQPEGVEVDPRQLGRDNADRARQDARRIADRFGSWLDDPAFDRAKAFVRAAESIAGPGTPEPRSGSAESALRAVTEGARLVAEKYGAWERLDGFEEARPFVSAARDLAGKPGA